MPRHATIQRESKEALLLTLLTDEDPSATTVQFSAVEPDARPATWSLASWVTPVVQRRDTRWEARVRTPTLGASGADVELAVGAYDTYVRILDGGEEIVMDAGKLVVE
jgi:hypothetical protein